MALVWWVMRHTTQALRDALDASTFKAVIGLMISETAARISRLKSERAFGHAIDEGKLRRLEDRARDLAAA